MRRSLVLTRGIQCFARSGSLHPRAVRCCAVRARPVAEGHQQGEVGRRDAAAARSQNSRPTSWRRYSVGCVRDWLTLWCFSAAPRSTSPTEWEGNFIANNVHPRGPSISHRHRGRDERRTPEKAARTHLNSQRRAMTGVGHPKGSAQRRHTRRGECKVAGCLDGQH